MEGPAQHARDLPGAEAARQCAQAKTFRDGKRDRADVVAARAAWQAEVAGTDPARLVFLDESGFDTRLTGTHAGRLYFAIHEREAAAWHAVRWGAPDPESRRALRKAERLGARAERLWRQRVRLATGG